MTTTSREVWLNRAAKTLNKWIAKDTGLKPHEKLLVSTGWPRNDKRGKVIGQCFPRKGGTVDNHVFVSPLISDPVDVLSVLLHELVHAADNCKSGHTGTFRKAWKALGFVGKPTCSTPGLKLRERLNALAEKLGPYEHRRIYPSVDPHKQTTRLLKVECGCGCIVRMTRKWLDEVGPPTCGCGERMVEA